MQRTWVMLSVAALACLGLVAVRRQAPRRRTAPNALAWDGEADRALGAGEVETADGALPAGDAAVYADAAERESSA